MSRFRAPLAFLLATLLATSASSQCGWVGAASPALDGPVYASAIVDTAQGPYLYVGLHSFESPQGVARNHVGLWSGRSWTYHSYMNGLVRAVAVYDDGSGPKLHVAGDFTTTQGGAQAHVARITPSSWAGLGAGIDGRVNALFVFDDGSGLQLYAGGSFTSAGGVPAQNLARWNGTAWSAVGAGVDGEVRALGAYDDGGGPALVVGGDFTNAGGIPAPRVATWDGSGFSALGGGVDGAVRAVRSFRADGHEMLAIGGDFTSAGGASAAHVARWNGSSWSAFGAGFDAPVHALAKHDFGGGLELCAGGTFGASGILATGPVARWNGTSWTPAGTGLHGIVRTLISYRSPLETEPRLVAGGQLGLTAADVGASNVVAYDGEAWRAFGQGLDGGAWRVLPVRDADGPAVIVIGDFAFAGGVRAERIGRWDGAQWSSLGTGISGGYAFDLLEHDDGSGRALYVAGEFTQAGGIETGAIARWDGASWSTVGAGLYGKIDALASVGGYLYASGGSDLIPGGEANRIVRWDGTTWTPIANLAAWANTIVGFDDGTGPMLLAGGDEVRRWNGTSWEIYAPGSGGASRLEVLDDGSGPKLYAGQDGLKRWDGSTWTTLYASAVGGFTLFDEGEGNGPRLFLSAQGRILERVGSDWQHVAFVVNGLHAEDLAVLDAEDGLGPRLVVGGDDGLWISSSPGPIAAMDGFATLLGCGQTGRLYCFGDGTSTACPCGNASAVGARAGCLHSGGTGGTIRARGPASIARDSLVLEGGGMTNSTALYVQGATLSNGGAGVVFGDGLKCAGSQFHRLGLRTNSGGASQLPSAGDAPISVRGHVLAPGLRHYQIRYRNAAAFCTPDSFNYTNAVEVLWSP